MSDVAQSIVFVECPTVLFQEAKAHLVELNRTKAEVRNGAGDLFRFTKQVMKALSDKARDKSIGRAPHWAAVACIEKLCEASVFLWDEKPRNGSVDIERYVKHGAAFVHENRRYVAKITSKVYPGDAAHIAYSVEAISIEANSVRGMTDSIPARGQSLDPNAANILQYFLSAVNGVGRQEENSEVKAGKA